MHRTVLFVGAGFSVPAGLPLGAELMTAAGLPHSRRAAETEKRVLAAWAHWIDEHPGAAAEEFITSIFEDDSVEATALWPALLRFIAYRIAHPFASFNVYERQRVSRWGDTILVSSVCEAHDRWWELLLGLTGGGSGLTVLTTNWDILVERALRPFPTERPRRPGFHYGRGPERVRASSAFPHAPWRRDPRISGSVPVLKLHGSLNWSVEDGLLVRYGDLRPAFRGDAAIVPPVTNKKPPGWARDLWLLAREALASARCILLVGYSVPQYDESVCELIREGLTSSGARVHVFDPAGDVVRSRVLALVPSLEVTVHSGLPEGTPELASCFSQ